MQRSRRFEDACRRSERNRGAAWGVSRALARNGLLPAGPAGRQGSAVLPQPAAPETTPVYSWDYVLFITGTLAGLLIQGLPFSQKSAEQKSPISSTPDRVSYLMIYWLLHLTEFLPVWFSPQKVMLSSYLLKNIPVLRIYFKNTYVSIYVSIYVKGGSKMLV